MKASRIERDLQPGLHAKAAACATLIREPEYHGARRVHTQRRQEEIPR
jgi:hypothetical protein